MYFDTKVKESREDFFNYEKELNELMDAIRGKERLIIVRGVRRVGKSSLMRVAFTTLNIPKVWVDTRLITMRVSMEDLFSDALISLLKQISLEQTFVKKLSGISIGPIGLAMEKGTFINLLSQLNSELKKKNNTAVIFIDEAQVLKEYKGDRLLAHINDMCENIIVVLAGSQVGLLDQFIGKEGTSPLFGRPKKIIEMKRLSREKALIFLESGFEQANKRVSYEELKEAVSRFDGLVGWLTYYGYYRLKGDHVLALSKVEEDGREIIKSELLSFLSVQRKKKEYLIILEAIAKKLKRWSDIKTYVEGKMKKEIADSSFFRQLTTLLDYGFVEKDGEGYSLSDPLAYSLFTSKK